ncbi:hypothetical protein PSECIP111951_04024 [Pseudoalteromonas holothuriae]|uniref:Uncharacterized protein n=1 Tax=Pseudoalteromonas holothuriae TaxID=2963714 RepID=A0A9W4R1L4_9GAMM|nr:MULTISPECIES: hypothetical protein [unclassified Pseudoalteromonas]CAH9062656.1 hypothetical protein PSECIP111854_03057 [Pseudoalteromonas sp. CIP111854]CAH9068115.1 hypothetical protein PSECIP111951_04024 [Pseudoalteromonas sp. CIP111951]
MKIKVYSAILLVIAVVSIGGYLSYEPYSEKTQYQKVSLSDEVNHEQTQPLSFFVSVDSSIRSDKQVVLSHSQLSWHMQLQAQPNSELLLGQLSNISYSQDSKSVSLVNTLPFKIAHTQNRFEELDLLGLPAEHTLQVTRQLFDLLSYDINHPLTLTQSQAQVTYRYQKVNNTIVRTVEKQTYLNANHKPQKEQQDWRLSLNNSGEIAQLNYVNTRYWLQPQQNYIVEQSVTVTKAPSRSLMLAKQADNVNAGIEADQLQSKRIQVTNKQTFEDALVELKVSLSAELARAVGQYLVDNYNAYEIQALLDAMPDSSSAIIYALQKLQTPQAEAMLVDLLQFEQTADLDKHKLAMALGRFGASSALSLKALQLIAEQPSHQAANTALLSLGTMAYFSPEQAISVKNYLQQNLSDQTSLSTTVLAVANSKDSNLLAQLPPLLHSADGAVKLNSIKVLSKHMHYQDTVVSALLSSPEPRLVAAFTRTILETKQVLSAPNIARLQQLQSQTHNPVVRKKITELLEG